MSVDDKTGYSPTVDWRRDPGQLTLERPRPAPRNFGFYAVRGTQFHQVNFPTSNNATPPVDQLLGVNDHGVAVGFYTNAQGNNRGYEYNIHTHTFTRVMVPGAPHGKKGPSLTAAAISNHGDVAGFYTAARGNTDGMLALPGH